jgi:hypothetical protein
MWETWVEDYYEDLTIPVEASISVTLRCHSNKRLTKDDIRNLPLWLSYRAIYAPDGVAGYQDVILRSQNNESGIKRTAIIDIDTAKARITQLEI